MSCDIVDFVPLFILEQLVQVLLPETTKEIFLDLNINLSSSPLELTKEIFLDLINQSIKFSFRTDQGNIPGP